MSKPAGQPRVRRNEWQVLHPPELGNWDPSLSVSMVIPAYDAGRLLPYVLAALAAQSYPSHLMEVVVVDDGPGILALPEVRPERTRIVRVDQGWGRANACHTGALVAEGDVLHWYDADMLAGRHEVEAQLRWHHTLDHAVVLGDKWFVDPAPVLAASPGEVGAAVAEDRVAAYFADQERVPHTWIEEIYDRTDDLRKAGWFALRTHAGATASVRRDLYLESGGMDISLRLGEDIALGARLGEVGAVFVPERRATSWHLGPTHVMDRRDQVNAYNDPFHADRSPMLHAKRRAGRSYTRPYVEVVLDTRGLEPEDVIASVDTVLASTVHDLVVTLLGDWSVVTQERMAVLDHPSLPARLIAATYAGDPRVRLHEALLAESADAPFRLVLPGAGFAPRRPALEKLLLQVEHTHDGLRLIRLEDGSTARIERTAAFARARRVAMVGEDLDSVVAEIAGVGEVAGTRTGFAPSGAVRPRSYPRTGGPPVSAEEAWSRADKALGPQ
ncbi:MAG: glycosyltransferase family 2 protein [Nocardioides sp.]